MSARSGHFWTALRNMCRIGYRQTEYGTWSRLASATHRKMTANEAAVLLRPFYFQVHPDKFAQEPDIGRQNEQSLQSFNGCLNKLLDEIGSTGKTEAEEYVHFVIWNATVGRHEKVFVSLRASSPQHLIRNALEACKLSTKTAINERNESEIQPKWTLREETMAGEDDRRFAQMVSRNDRKRTYFYNRQSNFTSSVERLRESALATEEAFSKRREQTKHEIELLLNRTGLVEVVWLNDWAVSHMRACLVALHRLLDLANAADSSPETRNVLKMALKGQKLKFGRGGGSFTACDASLHLAADDVLQQWQQACSEALVRRGQLPQLKSLEKELSQMLGGANISHNCDQSIVTTIDWMQTLLVRISVGDGLTRGSLRVNGRNTTVQVRGPSAALLMASDGCIHLPCTLDATSLSVFLHQNAPLARYAFVQRHKLLDQLQATANIFIQKMCLRSLSWDEGLDPGRVLDCLHRLEEREGSCRWLLKELRLHISAMDRYCVTSDGKLSLPVDCTF